MRLKLKEFSLLNILEIINIKCWIPIYNTDRLHKWCSFLVCVFVWGCVYVYVIERKTESGRKNGYIQILYKKNFRILSMLFINAKSSFLFLYQCPGMYRQTHYL